MPARDDADEAGRGAGEVQHRRDAHQPRHGPLPFKTYIMLYNIISIIKRHRRAGDKSAMPTSPVAAPCRA